MDDQSRIAMVRIGTPFPDDIADEVVYNLEDQIGSSSIRLNNNGGIIDKEEYYPFGDISFRTFTKKRYRYVGKEKDLESGLYYYGARYYAAWTCRFISVDPLASDYVHLTPYNNAGNKPINSIDIDGLQGAEEQKTSDTSTKSTTIANDPKIDLLPEVKVTGRKKLTGWEKFKAFGKGFIKGAAIAVVATVAIIAIAASAGTAAPFIIAGAAAYGAYQGVKTGYEIVSGKEAWTGNELGEEERWERGGELAGGIVGAKVGLKLKSKSNSSKTEIKDESIVLDGVKGVSPFSKVPKATELRVWAQQKGYELLSNKNGIETWGVKGSDGWRLKIKQPSTTPGIDSGSQKWRFSARTKPGEYYNPVSGQSGTRSQYGHMDLDPN